MTQAHAAREFSSSVAVAAAPAMAMRHCPHVASIAITFWTAATAAPMSMLPKYAMYSRVHPGSGEPSAGPSLGISMPASAAAVMSSTEVMPVHPSKTANMLPSSPPSCSAKRRPPIIIPPSMQSAQSELSAA